MTDTPIPTDPTPIEVVLAQQAVIVQQNEEILTILRPIAGFVQNDLPRLVESADPLIHGVKNSPVLKMLGISL